MVEYVKSGDIWKGVWTVILGKNEWNLGCANIDKA